MSVPLWSIRQFACINVDGRVVAITTKQGIGKAEVVGWRIRWDAPGFSGRSRSFNKAAYLTATAAHDAALDFVDQLRAAGKNDWAPDRRGRPMAPVSQSAVEPAPPSHSANMTLEELGRAWIDAKGGSPKTIQQHETSLAFALAHLPAGIIADEVTSKQMVEVLQARRATPSIKAAKLVRMGRIEPDDKRALSCSVRTETVFVQDLRNIFEHGVMLKPAQVGRHPMLAIRARKQATEPKDPSLETTFTVRQVVGVAQQVDDPVHRYLILLRGMTAVRTGEAAGMTVDDIDITGHTFTVRGTEGEAPTRLTPNGTSRASNHLKQRMADEERLVHYPDTLFVNAMIADLIAEAHRRHAAREEHLEALLERYRKEARKAHLVRRKAVELREHRAASPRVFTMPDGGPFRISDFDKNVWKPALHGFFTVEDPTHEDYSPLRETRFYNLRAAAIEFWIEDLEMEESRAAQMAGHTVETQRRRYRRPRGAGQPRPKKIDEASRAFEIGLDAGD